MEQTRDKNAGRGDQRWRGPSLAIAIGAWATVGAACGHGPPPVVHEAPSWVRVKDADVIVVPRPEGTATVSLWIPVGARHAVPPTTAFIAAMVASEAQAADVTFRVTAEATTFSMGCPQGDFERCLGRLARVVGHRTTGESSLTRARQSARTRRGRKLATAAEEAEDLALSRLMGESIEGWKPLGRAEHDDAISRADVEHFLARHYGLARPNGLGNHHGAPRVLFLAEGPVDRAAFEAAVGRVLVAFPRVKGAVPPSNPEGRPDAPPEVFEGDDDAVAMAVRTSTLGHARAAGLLLRQRVTTPSRIRAFSLGGHPVLLVTWAGGSAFDHAADGTHRVMTAVLEATRPVPAPKHAGALAEAWLAAHAHAVALPSGGAADAMAPPWGLAVTVRHGGPTSPDDARRRKATWEKTVGNVVAFSAHGGAREGGPGTPPNGLRMETQRIAGRDHVEVSLRFEGGAREDGPDTAGMALWLAHAFADACATSHAPALRLLGADFTAWVEPDAWGAVLRAPEGTWLEALDVALACVATPTDAALERARLRLVDEGLPLASRLRMGAAELLFPERPGIVAPTGVSRALRVLPTAVAFRAWQARVVGQRLRVTVSAPADEHAVAAAAARRLLLLSPGAGPAPPPPVGPALLAGARDDAHGGPGAIGTDPGADRTGGHVVFGMARAQRVGDAPRSEPRTGAPAPRAACSGALRQHLERAGFDVPWSDEGVFRAADGTFEWAAFALPAHAPRLEALPAVLLEAASAPAPAAACGELLRSPLRARFVGP